jgi:hypothetical protein
VTLLAALPPPPAWPLQTNRDSNPQLLEALAALDPDVTRFLTPGTAGTHSASVTYPTACQALTAHLAKHMAGMLQLCLSAAVQQLQRMEWMGTWVQVAAGAVREAAVEQSLRQVRHLASGTVGTPWCVLAPATL